MTLGDLALLQSKKNPSILLVTIVEVVNSRSANSLPKSADLFVAGVTYVQCHLFLIICYRATSVFTHVMWIFFSVLKQRRGLKKDN